MLLEIAKTAFQSRPNVKARALYRIEVGPDYCKEPLEVNVLSWAKARGLHLWRFRLDQAFINPAARRYLIEAGHAWAKSDASSRRDAVSDHAAVMIDLDPASPARTL